MSDLSSTQITMPKWPAAILFGIMAISAYPAVTASAPRGETVAAVAAPAPAVQSVKPLAAESLRK